METNHPSSVSPAGNLKPRWTYGRCFRWGIALWLLVWMVSVCVYLDLEIQVAGIPEFGVGMGRGAIGFGTSRTATSVTRIDLHRSFVWDPGPSREEREIGGIPALLASGGWRFSSDRSTIWFPAGGLLWLWLAGAWVVVVVRRRRLAASPQPHDTGPSPSGVFSHSTLLALLTIGLGVTLCFLVARSRYASNVRVCAMQLDYLQCCVRSWQGMQGLMVGQPLDWKEIADPGKYVSSNYLKCPSGDDYELLPVVPDVGQPAARCPHPEHREYFYKHAKITGEAWQPEPTPQR